ncbi:MAG: arsenite efflux transporter metallochaperone ArsD [Anaerolineales bacterium]
MTETLHQKTETARQTSMVDLEIFDPPVCCPTGTCGPTQDQTLLDVSEMIVTLESEGYRVERYQMTTHPEVFLNNPDVMSLVNEKKTNALPITVIRGELVSEGKYISLSEVRQHLDRGAA